MEYECLVETPAGTGKERSRLDQTQVNAGPTCHLSCVCVCVSVEMMMKVEDVIIKALIAGESHIISACDVFQTHRRSCFGE